MIPRMTSRTRIATATVAALVASLLGACARPPQPGAATPAGATAGVGTAPTTQAAPGKQVELDAETRLRQLLVQVALGQAPADTLIHGPTVLNVVTGAWEKDQDIVIRSGRIAWVGNAGGWKGTAKETVDASKEWAVPGFGESHKHIESTYLTPEYEASLVIPRGNTFTVEDSHELSNVVGNHNVAFWLEAEAKGSPLKIFPSVGSATPPTIYEHGGGYYGYNEMQGFLQSDLRVISLGEVMDWPAVIDSKAGSGQRIWEMIQATRNQRGVVEGHGAGLTDPASINAFAAAGLSSDHEARLPEEGYEKLKRGVFLEVRVDTAQDLFPYLVKQGLKDWSNVSVTTDDRDVYATLQLGSMDYNIRNAISLGVPTITAYQMGSYNTARHFHIDHLVGSITPGRHADVVLLSDPDKVAITRVFANGRLASRGNEYLLEVPKIEYPEWVRQTVKVGRKVEAADFVIRAPAGATGRRERRAGRAVLVPAGLHHRKAAGTGRRHARRRCDARHHEGRRRRPLQRQGRDREDVLAQYRAEDARHGAREQPVARPAQPLGRRERRCGDGARDQHTVGPAGRLGAGQRRPGRGEGEARGRRPDDAAAGEGSRRRTGGAAHRRRPARMDRRARPAGSPALCFPHREPVEMAAGRALRRQPGRLRQRRDRRDARGRLVTRRRGWPPALSRSRLLPWLACLFLPITAAQAHLLNMTKAQAAIAADGAVTVTLQVDLNRAAGGGAAYHALEPRAGPARGPDDARPARPPRRRDRDHARRRGGVTRRAAREAARCAAGDLRRSAGLADDRRRAHRARLPPGDAPVTGRFTAAFRFEEPIALTLTDVATGRNMTRWLVTAQTTPPFRTCRCGRQRRRGQCRRCNGSRARRTKASHRSSSSCASASCTSCRRAWTTCCSCSACSSAHGRCDRCCCSSPRSPSRTR
jgi:adenine deaminase